MFGMDIFYKTKNRTRGLDFFWGACVKDVRKGFERINDATIYIPDLSSYVTAR